MINMPVISCGVSEYTARGRRPFFLRMKCIDVIEEEDEMRHQTPFFCVVDDVTW